MEKFIDSDGSEMIRRFCINGWCDYKRRYFFDVGGFTSHERQLLEDGAVLEKDGNRFWISIEKE